ncbi:MAG: RNA 3'-terminal phosphate cyclase [Myxococcota bacterium]
MIELDGSQGEGGGQILRTALALSAITGSPFRIRGIRAGRAKPGLLRQHLTGVRAVAAVCGAAVDGDALGATSLTFRPGRVSAGAYRFEVGSAGSAGLVLQAVLPVLLVADGPSTVVVTGGTHNPSSPPAPFLVNTLVPLLNRLGPTVTLTVDKCGFYPAGGGQYTVEVAPAPLRPLELVHRGELRRVEPVAIVSNLRRGVAHRELDAARQALGLAPRAGRVIDAPSPGPGNAVWIEAETDAVTEVFTAFGEKGVEAEAVAAEAAAAFAAWRDADVPVGEHLADQLLVPLALAGGGVVRTTAPSLHTTTNVAVIRQFLDRSFALVPHPTGATITVS